MALIHTEERVGKPHKMTGYSIFTVEKNFQYQPPGMRWVLFWHRPSAVIIQHKDGTDEVLNIIDHTRKAQLIIFAFGLIGALLIQLMLKTRS